MGFVTVGTDGLKHQKTEESINHTYTPTHKVLTSNTQTCTAQMHTLTHFVHSLTSGAQMISNLMIGKARWGKPLG